MTKKLNKRGFTIVELVVVIVVIAILAAVLIPTVSSLVSKANKSKDTQLVKNLNTALAADVNKHNTMSEALAAAAEFGYDVAKINAAEKDNEILWDSVNDVFCYLDDKQVTYIPDSKDASKTVNKWDYWQICTSVPTEQKYSIYWNGTVGTTGEFTVGFDSGNTSGNTITYTGANSVVIRTNTGDSLTVNNESATVSHYGEANVVTITAVAPNSYHEFGAVTEIRLTEGHVVVESTGSVTSILVQASATDTFSIDSTGTVGGVAATDNTVAGTLSQKVTGVDSALVSTEKVESGIFAAGLGTKASPYLIETAEQFANINKLDSEMANGKAYYFKQTEDINWNGTSIAHITGGYDGGNHKIIAKTTRTNFDTIFGEIGGFVSFENIEIQMGKTGVSLLQTADWGTNYGADFTNITFSSTESLVTVNAGNFGFVVMNSLYTGKGSPVTYNFTDITNNVNISNAGNCIGFIVGSGPFFYSKTTVNYTNCVNNGNLIGTNYVGFLYGNGSYFSDYYYNVGVNVSENVDINVTGCANKGILSSPAKDAKVKMAPGYDGVKGQSQVELGGSFLTQAYAIPDGVTVVQNDTQFKLKNNNDEKVTYKLAFSVASSYWKKDQQAWTDDEQNPSTDNKLSDVWNISNGTKYLIDLENDYNATGELTKSFHAYDLRTAKEKGIVESSYSQEDRFAIVVKEGVTYLILNLGDYYYIDSNVSVLLYAYQGEILVGSKVIK